jgi:hypothetical protein
MLRSPFFASTLGARICRCLDFGLGLGRDRRIMQCGDDLVVGLAGHGFTIFERLRQLADPVDDGENGADEAGIGGTAAGADLGEHVFRGVAELLESRQIEEAAIALHGVDEAEDLVEPCAVAGLALPGDDGAGQGLQHLARLGQKFVDQIVHDSARSFPLGALSAELVKKPFTGGSPLSGPGRRWTRHSR